MISIIIPIYNAEKTIKDCLESILAQTFKDYEVILINDGSKDKSAKLIESYRSKFVFLGKPFKFVDRQENKGAQATRNEGLKHAQGEYLLFLDADIKLEPTALNEFMVALEKNLQASYVYSSHYFGRKLFKFWPFDAEKLKTMPYIHSSSLIRREHFPKSGWDERVKRLQDWDLFLTMLEENHIGVWVDKILFRINPGGTMSNWLPSIFYLVFPFLRSVKKYIESVQTIKDKHNLK